MPKPSKELEARVDRLLGAREPTEKRPMFGCAAWFARTNAQMCGGVYGDGLMLRIGQPAAEKWIRLDRASAFDPMGGRPMREYIYLEAGQLQTGAQLPRWLDRALEFTTQLPQKEKRRRKRASG